MENISDTLNGIGKKAKTKANTGKKRKWREIEQLKEKFQLERELKIYDDSLEYMLDEF